MIAGDYLRQAELLPSATLDDVVGDGTILVLAPHPDDESIGCGGLIAAAVEAGRDVRVIVLSDGSGSHPAQPPAAMAALRQREARAAVHELGLPADAIAFLDLPDGALPTDPDGCEAAAARILGCCGDPATILATWRHDPHCDHVAAWAIAGAITRQRPHAQRLAYPVWGWVFAYPIPGFPVPAAPTLAAPPKGWRLPIAPWLPAKRRAIRAHRSQLGEVVEAGFRLPEAMLRLADRPYEIFLHDAGAT